MPIKIYKSKNADAFVKAVQVTCDTEWTLNEKLTMLKETDYLVKDSDGNLARYTKEEFEKTFIPI